MSNINISKDIKILVVDDFVTMRRILKNTLEQLGFTNIIEAEDGQIGLEKAKSEQVDFIISDWSMPNMMGLDLLRAVKNNEQLSSLPFLMVAAESQKEQLIEAVQQGVSNYILKPFNPETFGEKLSQIFK
jgi:two-component system chemotaxis response regulator CheY